jgi:hypothetical protein
MMASRALEAGDVPGVLDLPLTGRQEEAAHQWRPRLALRSGQRLPLRAHHAKPADPIGMLASAHERPAPLDPPAAGRLLDCSAGLGGAGDDHRAVLAHGIVGMARQQRRKETGAIGDHRAPADRAVDPRQRPQHVQRRRQVEFESAVAARCQQAEDADGSQGRHQVGWDSARGLDFRRARGDGGRQAADLGVKARGRVGGRQGFRRRKLIEGSGGMVHGATPSMRDDSAGDA